MGKKRKVSQKERQQRIDAAKQRVEREEQHKEQMNRRKKIFTVVVCVILVLALGLPTVALSVLGG